jgi:hypothetical protein
MLTYIGSGDRLIVRPPGLSDMPGGAAVSGVIAALLAFGFATRADTRLRTRAYYLVAVLVAITVVYLTQVRSMLLMLVICMQAVAFVSLRQGRAVQGGWRAGLATALDRFSGRSPLVEMRYPGVFATSSARGSSRPIRRTAASSSTTPFAY